MVTTLLSQSEPGLNILTGGTRLVAGRKEINIDRPQFTGRPRTLGVSSKVGGVCQVSFGRHHTRGSQKLTNIRARLYFAAKALKNALELRI